MCVQRDQPAAVPARHHPDEPPRLLLPPGLTPDDVALLSHAAVLMRASPGPSPLDEQIEGVLQHADDLTEGLRAGSAADVRLAARCLGIYGLALAARLERQSKS